MPLAFAVPAAPRFHPRASLRHVRERQHDPAVAGCTLVSLPGLIAACSARTGCTGTGTAASRSSPGLIEAGASRPTNQARGGCCVLASSSSLIAASGESGTRRRGTWLHPGLAPGLIAATSRTGEPRRLCRLCPGFIAGPHCGRDSQADYDGHLHGCIPVSVPGLIARAAVSQLLQRSRSAPPLLATGAEIATSG